MNKLPKMILKINIKIQRNVNNLWEVSELYTHTQLTNKSRSQKSP